MVTFRPGHRPIGVIRRQVPTNRTSDHQIDDRQIDVRDSNDRAGPDPQCPGLPETPKPIAESTLPLTAPMTTMTAPIT
jgi:hypothetical protein